METINSRIKQVRKQLNLNQKDFADMIGISRTHISGIENGKDNPSTSLIKLICYKYNISEDWLINGIGSSLPDFDTLTNEGLQSKYNLMRNLLEQWLRTQNSDNLKNSVEAFSFFVSILTSKNLNEENQRKYLENISLLMNTLEQLIFDTYSLANYQTQKNDYKMLLSYKTKTDEALVNIEKNIKDSANVYLEQYKLDIKL